MSASNDEQLGKLFEQVREFWRPQRPMAELNEASKQLKDAIAEQERVANWSTDEWVVARNAHHEEQLKSAALFAEQIEELRQHVAACERIRLQYSPMEPVYGDFDELIRHLESRIDGLQVFATPPSEKMKLARFKRQTWSIISNKISLTGQLVKELELVWARYEELLAIRTRVEQALGNATAASPS